MSDDNLDNLMKEILEPDSAKVLTTQMVVRQASLFKINVADLRKLCAKFPDNPKSVTFMQSTKSHHVTDEVLVERMDLEALIKNADTYFILSKKDIETSPGVSESVVIQEKQLTEPIA